MKTFNDIYIENEIHKTQQDYIGGVLDKEKAIHILRKLWGKIGYQVDKENAGIYLDKLK